MRALETAFCKVIACAVCLGISGIAVAELANVILKDGTRLRGDVTTTDTEIVVRNDAGEVKFRKSEVDAVEWANAPASLDEEYLRRFRVLAADDLDGHFALAEWAHSKERYDLVRKQCTYILGLDPNHANARLLLDVAQRGLAERDDRPVRPRGGRARTGDGLAAPDLLGELDVKRLKMLEFPLDDPPKNARVRFVGRRGEPPLPEVVRRELSAAGTLDGGARQRLEGGKPAEQLGTIVELTGVKHVSRVEISGDPPAIATFRRRVLPLVARGCATAGCHGGDDAAVFRMPEGAPASDEHVYTSFLILDQVPTRFGPLINRKRPAQSPLLSFMLPRTASDQPHPEVPGERLTARVRGERDPNFAMLVDWIESLRAPHPEYELDYQPPAWLVELHRRMAPPDAPASQPATVPSGDGG
jgi:hypothetical protein